MLETGQVFWTLVLWDTGMILVGLTSLKPTNHRARLYSTVTVNPSERQGHWPHHRRFDMLQALPRKTLQALCKQHGIKANGKVRL